MAFIFTGLYMPLKRENRKRSAAILAAWFDFQPAARARERRQAIAGWKPALLFITGSKSFMHCLDVRQLPGLIEKFLLWTVEAEQHFKLATGLCRNPVRILTGRRVWSEINVHR